jgi:hypothetical protein
MYKKKKFFLNKKKKYKIIVIQTSFYNYLINEEFKKLHGNQNYKYLIFNNIKF